MAPASASISAERQPVNAPCRSGRQSCPPTSTPEPASGSAMRKIKRRRRADRHARPGRLLVERRGDRARLVERGGQAVHLPVSGDQRPRRGQLVALLVPRPFGPRALAHSRGRAVRQRTPIRSPGRRSAPAARRMLDGRPAGPLYGGHASLLPRLHQVVVRPRHHGRDPGRASTFLGTGGIRNRVRRPYRRRRRPGRLAQVTQPEFQKMFQRNEQAYQAAHRPEPSRSSRR